MSVKDIPFAEACQQAVDLIRRGHDIYQKFTCAGCGKRLQMEQVNKMFEQGTCDECPATTDIKAQGCGYMLHARADKDPDILQDIIKRGRRK
jgi:hypothetical protein